MLNCQGLFEMSQVDIVSVDTSALTDITTVVINQEQPHEEKILSFIAQMGNPYCFISGGIPVRVQFTAEDRSVSQALLKFFSQLKQ